MRKIFSYSCFCWIFVSAFSTSCEKKNPLSFSEKNSSKISVESYVSSMELDFLEDYLEKDHVVFEVGANLGLWTKEMVERNPYISLFAFEPIPEVFARLKKKLSKKTLFMGNLALSNKRGVNEFFFYNQNWKSTRMSGFLKKPRSLTESIKDPIVIKVPQDTLDHFCYHHNVPTIHLLKIHTIGGYLEIIEGAKNQIEKGEIYAISFNQYPGFDQKGIVLNKALQFFQSRGFSVFHLRDKKLKKVDMSQKEHRTGVYYALSPKGLKLFFRS